MVNGPHDHGIADGVGFISLKVEMIHATLNERLIFHLQVTWTPQPE
jgi:hypothetical protein